MPVGHQHLYRHHWCPEKPVYLRELIPVLPAPREAGGSSTFISILRTQKEVGRLPRLCRHYWY